MSHRLPDSTPTPRWQWWLALVTGGLTIVCGSIGVWKYDQEFSPGVSHGLSPVYSALQMLILHPPQFERGMNGWIEAGRWLGAVTLIATSMAIWGRRLRLELYLLRLTRWSGHSVVCGLGRKGFEIVRCLKQRAPATRVVAIDPAPDRRLLAKAERLGVCVIQADAAQAEILKQARIAHAGEIFVITPTDEVNLRIALELRQQMAGQKNSAAAIHVHLADIHLREELQRQNELDRQKPEAGVLHFFDLFDHEARRVLHTLPLDGPGIREHDPRSVHVVIFGFGRMGRSLALRAVKMGHFANGKLLRVSIIDRAASQQRDRFLFRYPVFKQQKICDLTFYEAEAESLTARDFVEKWAAEPDTLLQVFVCLDDDARAAEVGMRLKSILQKHPEGRLLVRLRSQSSLVPLLGPALTESSPSLKAGGRIIPFGMVDDASCEDTLHREFNEDLARAIHERFVNQRLADSRRTPATDPALRPWKELGEDLRESNRQQADHIPIKLRAIGCRLVAATDTGEAASGFTPAEIELLARVEHQRWRVERWLAGWRYGTPSDKARGISENLVDWEELDDSIKQYDRDMVMNIPAVAGSRFKVVRDKALSS